MSKKIYVGNMNYNTSERQLQDLFGQYGEVSSVNIIVDRFTGKAKGFGFVEMENQRSCGQGYFCAQWAGIHGQAAARQ